MLARFARSTINPNEAVEYLSIPLTIEPMDRVTVLCQRRNVRVSLELWEEALSDTGEVYSASPF